MKIIRSIARKIEHYRAGRPSTSYAQTGEDLILNFYFKNLGVLKGSYIDIGAHHPTYLNNTYLLYKNGWRGINVEPQIENFIRFQKLRPLDKHICKPVGGTSGIEKIYVFDASALSTLSAERASLYESYGHNLISSDDIEVIGFDVLLEMSKLKECDLLSIDVEGYKQNILQGMFRLNFFPRVILCETVEYHPKIESAPKNTELIDWIERHGYSVYADTFLNTIFVRK